ncbi:MAG: methyltransferase domain-containing protein [Deltaproteobacteria bacterium]|nr:methyltransferase domain-containing protein [Deltaproteobacteria bacterium]
MELRENTVLHTPKLRHFTREGIEFFIDANTPNWVATDDRGAFILSCLQERIPFGSILRKYSERWNEDSPKSWFHVHTFVSEALRHRIAGSSPFPENGYLGRERYLQLSQLREFWVHVHNFCNLSCSHCLVGSSPHGDRGLPMKDLRRLLDEAYSLGARRFYFTGGEPLARKEIFDLVEEVTRLKASELIILTNATLFSEERLKKLDACDRERLFLQVSLDGTTSSANDRLRGDGTFEKILEGTQKITALGFTTSLTAVVTQSNLKELEQLPELAARCGARSVHLMWMHRRGRAMERCRDQFPTVQALIALCREVKKGADQVGVLFDNYASIQQRINAPRGTRFDLSNACWESLCLYSDGKLYPSAALAGHPPLVLGDALQDGIEKVWKESAIAQKIRQISLIQKRGLNGDGLHFLTGGGDIEHSYFYGEPMEGEGNFLAEDPYYPVYAAMAEEVMVELAKRRKEIFNGLSGYNPPLFFHAMGEGAMACGIEEGAVSVDREVQTVHSNCVLSFDVERPHKVVQSFYGKAAQIPQADLCCPTNYPAEDTLHIPKEVLDRFYGCGSPVSLTGLKEGETYADLGSGGGIDCFIAAKKVGSRGKVFGIDMTDEMLKVANKNRPRVAQALGYDGMEFRKGFLEKIPLSDQAIDCVTSNCVINLSPDKKAVFAEIWRILKDHGRFVISDIVCEEEVPLHLRVNEHLWGECLAGALTEGELFSFLEQAGFYGIEVLQKSYWKEVEGYPFYSVTVRGYKYEKKKGCVYIGQRVIYHGPFTAVMDEEGHLFPRHVPVEVCTDTAAKLSAAPYKTVFTVTDPTKKITEINSEGCCTPGGGCC